MEFAKYYILVGILLLAMGLTSSIFKKLPLTPSLIYLIIGITLGKNGFNFFNLDIKEDAKLIEVLSEITVIISLFTVGLKLKIPINHRQWFIPLSLATLSMTLSVFFLATVGYFLFQLPLGQSILLGAILAPTDPVLASEVQLKDPEDRNILKFNLTSEGGMNDGTAFPFVMLGLGVMGAQGNSWSVYEWFKVDFLWAILAGLSVGAALGLIVSKLVFYLKRIRQSFYLEDFLTIGSIALSYGIALHIHAYGFLAVFANALIIRQIEVANLPDNVLSFNEQLERIFEVISVVLVGLLIDLNSLNFKILFCILALFFVLRPLAILLGTFFYRCPFKEKFMLSWFGVKGIGSIYYLFFSLNFQGFYPGSEIIINTTVYAIFSSILLHGCSVKPLLKAIQPARKM